jgi:hypothetical protein
MTSPDPVRIVKVDLSRFSHPTSRDWLAKDGEDTSPKYDVILFLSRPLSGYERNAFLQGFGAGEVDLPSMDPNQLTVRHTTLEQVRDGLPDFAERLTKAVADGAAAQAAKDTEQQAAANRRSAEEARLAALVEEINSKLD